MSEPAVRGAYRASSTVRLLLAAILLGFLLPGASALGSLAGGALVSAEDPDVQPVTRNPSPNANLCYYDGNEDELYNPGERVFWRRDAGAIIGPDAACGSTSANDVVLSGPGFGTRVLVGSPDHGQATRTPASSAVCYYDADGNARFTLGDTLYLQLGSASCGSIAFGHVRWTAYGSLAPGTSVVGGDADDDLATVAADVDMAVDFDFWDTNGDGAFDGDDVLYIDFDASETVSVMDVRLRPFGLLGAGSVVTALDGDAVPHLAAASPAANLCYLDADDDDLYDAGEAVVWRKDPGAIVGANAACGAAGDTSVEANDVLLSGSEYGTKVLVGHPLYNAPSRTFQTGRVLCYYDADGNSRFTAGDTLYLLTMTAACRGAAVGDLRLTPYGIFHPGSHVAAGNSDINLGTIATGLSLGSVAAFSSWDANGDALFNGADVLYADVDGSGSVTVMDVRLTPLGGLSAGTAVSATDGDAVAMLVAPSSNANVCFMDGNDNAGYDPGEVVVWRKNTGLILGNDAACGAAGDTTTEAGDVVLSAPSFGERIRIGTPNFNVPVRTFDSGRALCYYDADGNAALTAGDTLYLLPQATFCRALAVGDLRLTPYPPFVAGSFLAAGNADINLGTTSVGLLANPASDWRFWDTDGDGSFTGNDLLYIDADGTATVTVMDVRVAGLSSGGGGPSPPQPQPTPGTPTPTPTPPSPTNETLQSLLGQIAQLSAQLNSSLSNNADLQAQLAQLTAQLNATLAENAALRAELANATADLPPVARITALAPQECTGGGAEFVLDATGSFDPEGQALTFRWSATAGNISDADLVRTRARFPFGATLVTLTVSDGNGSASATVTVAVQDTQAPAVFANVGGSGWPNATDGPPTSLAAFFRDGGWSNGPVDIRFSAWDRCGGAMTHFDVDHGGFHPGTFLTLAREGAHNVTYFADDGRGHQSQQQLFTVRLDLTQPRTQLNVTGLAGNASWWRSAVNLTAIASDPFSGVQDTFLAIDGGPFEQLAPGGGYRLTAEGRHTVRWYSVDRAGNVEPTQSRDVDIDTMPPRVTLDERGRAGANYWWLGDVEVTAHAEDAGSGIARVEHGAAEEFVPGATVVATEEGANGLVFRAFDLAGNEARNSTTVRIDRTDPAARITAPQAGDVFYLDTYCCNVGPLTLVVGDMNVSSVNHDSISGLARVALFVDGELRNEIPGGNATTPRVFNMSWAAGDEALGTHILELRVTDHAGRTASRSLAVTTVPTTVAGIEATGQCQALLDPAFCADLPAAPHTAGEACRVVLSEFVCGKVGALEQACAGVMAENVCRTLGEGLDDAGSGPDTAPLDAVAVLAQRG